MCNMIERAREAVNDVGLDHVEHRGSGIQNPDPWLVDFIGGRPTISGIRITEQTALCLSAIWRGVHLIARDVGKLPFHVIERGDDGSKQRANTHPAYKVMSVMPDEGITPMRQRAAMTAEAILRGNSYAWLRFAGSGEVLRAVKFKPGAVSVERKNGKLRYFADVNGTTHTLEWWEVLHIAGLGWDGVQGYPLIEYAADSLGLAKSQEDHQARYFRSGASDRVVLSHPNAVDRETRNNIKADWRMQTEGKPHEAVVLMEGIEPKVLGFTSKDAQIIESRGFSLKDAAMWLNLPVHKLGGGVGDTTSYNSLEMEQQAYLDEALDPWLTTWEQECSLKLLRERDYRSGRLCLQFERKALVRADFKTRMEGWALAIQNTMVTPDLVADREDLPRLPNGLGALPLRPANMLVAGQEPEPEETETDGDSDETKDGDGETNEDRSVTDRIRHYAVRQAAALARRCCSRVWPQANRAAKNPDGFDDFVNAIEDRNRRTLVDELLPVAGLVVGEGPAAAKQANAAADSFFRGLREVLLANCECRADQLCDMIARLPEGTAPSELAAIVSDAIIETVEAPC